MIATAYQLPFKVEHSAAAMLLSGRPLSILVRTQAPDLEGLVGEALRRFTRIAAAGAFGSRNLAPWHTDFVALAQSSGDPRTIVVRADPCRVAPEAWIILCHLLLKVHRRVSIEAVEVLADMDAAPVSLTQAAAESTYPSVFESLPFALHDTQPEGGGYSLFMTLASPLTANHEATLNDWLDAWVQVVGNGGFGLAPIDPTADYVEPYGEGVAAYDNIVEWAVFKLRADPVAAIDALLNLFACFHRRCQPIRSLEIG